MPADPSSPLGRLRVESDKCDWRLATPALDVRGVGTSAVGDIRAELPSGRMRIDSDKCDWRVSAPSLDIAGQEGEVRDVRAGFSQGRLRADSDKCDFRLQVTDVERLTQADVSARELRLRASGPSLRADVCSSKCDWSIRGTGDWDLAAPPPAFHARLSSDKCDFSLRIRVGIRNGPAWTIRATGSAKCDFRLAEPVPDEPDEG